MPKTVKLLLTDNVDNLGIVGDVVNVRTGYARNFLLPRDLATTPSDELIKALASKRADAEKSLAELRTKRESMIGKMQGVEISLTRSCNDQGILYGAITQQDIATALGEKGFEVKPREVRIPQVIKRIDSYNVHVKFDSDLDAEIKLWVVADRKLDLDKAKDDEGAGAQGAAAGGAEGGAPGGGSGGGGGGGGERPRREREDRDDRRGGRRGEDAFAALDRAMAAEKAAKDAKKSDGGGSGGGGEGKGGKKADKGGDKAEKKADKPAKGEKAKK